MQTFTQAEVAGYSTEHDMRIIIDKKVYNVTEFAHLHPGGRAILQKLAGKDGTEKFEIFAHSDQARELLKTLYIGDVID